MTREEILKAIYEKIADKPASIYLWLGGEEFVPVVMIWDLLDWILNTKNIDPNNPPCWLWFENTVDYEGKDFIIRDHYCGELLYIWIEKRRPIDEQPIECIEFIYSLTK